MKMDAAKSGPWRPIAEADRGIATVQTFATVGITLRNSHPVWVRDEDGRVYEAVWTDHRDGYWWDIEGESPTDPVAFMPHPLDPKYGEAAGSFQDRVRPWMLACFGAEIAADRLERADRFIEEALELVQSGEYPKQRAYALIDYVYGREKGEPHQEVGGVMVTLAAYCLAHAIDMHQAGETELERIWTKVEKIRAKQAAKPTGSALPVAQDSPIGNELLGALIAALPYVETAEDDPAYKPGAVARVVKQIRNAIAKAGDK